MPPSCIITSNRDLVNIYFPFDFSLLFNLQVSYSNMAMDMNIDMFRNWSVNSSTNCSIASSIHLNMFSIAYIEQIISESQGLALFYAIPR